MFFSSKRNSLLLLGITSLVCSRALFAFFNDPEGPNLLVVIGMAAILYTASLTVYIFGPSAAGFKKFLLAVLLQVLLAACLYFFLR